MARSAAVTLRSNSSPPRGPRAVDRLHPVDVQVAEDEPLAAAPAPVDVASESGETRLSVEHAGQLVAREPVALVVAFRLVLLHGSQRHRPEFPSPGRGLSPLVSRPSQDPGVATRQPSHRRIGSRTRVAVHARFRSRVRFEDRLGADDGVRPRSRPPGSCLRSVRRATCDSGDPVALRARVHLRVRERPRLHGSPPVRHGRRAREIPGLRWRVVARATARHRARGRPRGSRSR